MIRISQIGKSTERKHSAALFLDLVLELSCLVSKESAVLPPTLARGGNSALRMAVRVWNVLVPRGSQGAMDPAVLVGEMGLINGSCRCLAPGHNRKYDVKDHIDFIRWQCLDLGLHHDKSGFYPDS